MSNPTHAELWAFAADWYRKLDEHVPAGDITWMVAETGLEFVLPEGVLRGRDEFARWYEGVIRVFFDEVHTLDSVEVTGADHTGTAVKVVVNWQARRWRPPSPRSEWIGFDAYQTWRVARHSSFGYPMITRYVVDELRPMPGSPPL